MDPEKKLDSSDVENMESNSKGRTIISRYLDSGRMIWFFIQSGKVCLFILLIFLALDGDADLSRLESLLTKVLHILHDM